MTKPRQRVWIKGTVEEAVILPHKETSKKMVIPKKKITKSKLQKLAQVLDSGGWKALEKTENPHTTQVVMKQEKIITTKEAEQLAQIESEVKPVQPTDTHPATQIQSPIKQI